MTTSYYDVVVLGTRLAPLTAAALLAKRGFRVLVLGGDEPEPTYVMEGFELPRQPFTFLSTHSPVARRILSELALHQAFRRRAASLDPSLQLVLPRHRIDLAASEADRARELARELPTLQRPIEDIFTQVQHGSDDLDRLVERDLVWPPQGFFERREFARAAQHHALTKAGTSAGPLAELPETHPFRTAIQAPVAFSSHMDPEQTKDSPVATMRLLASWLNGAASLEGGYAALRDMLIDKVLTSSGDVRKKECATRILTQRGRATGVRLAGTGEEIGSGFVIAGDDLATTLGLLSDRRPFEGTFERFGEPQARFFRYTVNFVMANEGAPAAMAHDVFVVRDAHKPLFGGNALRIEKRRLVDRDATLLVVEALLPRRGVEEVPGYLLGVRAEAWDALRSVVPFLDEHLLLVDSPHDGRDGEVPREKRLVPPPEPWSRGQAHMRPLWGFPVTGSLGVCAFPVRTPIKRLLLASDQVVPGLGEEGELLAAWSAARVVEKSDRSKERMRRGLFTKVEI